MTLSANDYRQRIVASVCARNDHNVSDVQFFTGNGRTARLRPPLPGEEPERVRSLRALGFTPWVLLHRPDAPAVPDASAAPEEARAAPDARAASDVRAVALLALDPDESADLNAALSRMGDIAVLALTRKASIRWWPL
jgi:hypothetical protein